MSMQQNSHTKNAAPVAGRASNQGVNDAIGRALRDLRISVTDKCNFRCTYCMPADRYGEHYQFLPRQALLSFEEIARLARAFAGLGVTKLRVTGGEPLLRKELPVLIEMLARIEGVEDIALTTNGVLLGKFASSLKAAGLGRITVSLDSLDEAVFRRMSGRTEGPQLVLDGIHAVQAVGLGPVKVNTVVQRDVNEEGVVDLARHFRHTKHVVRFIEYMDVGTCNGWTRDQMVPSSETLARIHAEFPLAPLEKRYPGEVAERYRYLDGAGEVGFISSVSRPFCGNCSRARLSADGKLYLCLFANEGIDLRTPLRDGAREGELGALVEQAWRRRMDRYSELRFSGVQAQKDVRRVEMYHIGG